MSAFMEGKMMITKLFKRLAARLSPFCQHEIKCIHYRRQILMRSFLTNEPEYGILDSLISHGDWAIDIGANIGHYTKKLSDLVGPKGRIIALEPVPETFSFLAGNVQLFKYHNVSLFNVAASDQIAVVGMSIPYFDTGLRNYYEAHLTNDGSALKVITLPLDILNIPHAIKLVKIDVEGHELAVLRGMINLLRENHPAIIIEANSPGSIEFLLEFGYKCRRLHGSPNYILQ